MKTRKTVMFSDSAKENVTFAVLGKPHSAALRKLWFERCRSNQHELFEKDLNKFASKGLSLKKFFEKEGWTILNRAVIGSLSSKELRHICTFIPEGLIVKLLRDDNCSILRAFILGTSETERSRGMNTDDLQERFEKIKILVNLNSVDIINFLKDMLLENNAGEGVKEQIERALTKSKLTLEVG